MRQKAKAVNFGLLFGQRAEGLRAYAQQEYGIRMSAEEAEETRGRFFAFYRGLAAWQRWVAADLAEEKPLYTPFGREQWFYPHELPAALAFVVQGGEAEILLHALAPLHDALDALGAELVAVIHDEIILEVPMSNAKVAGETLRTTMTDAFLAVLPRAPVTGLCDLKHGQNWADRTKLR